MLLKLQINRLNYPCLRVLQKSLMCQNQIRMQSTDKNEYLSTSSRKKYRENITKNSLSNRNLRKKFFWKKAFYGNFSNVKPHQLKIIGDLAHSTDENNDKKAIKNTRQFLKMERSFGEGRIFATCKKLQTYLSKFQDKIPRIVVFIAIQRF